MDPGEAHSETRPRKDKEQSRALRETRPMRRYLQTGTDLTTHSDNKRHTATRQRRAATNARGATVGTTGGEGKR